MTNAEDIYTAWKDQSAYALQRSLLSQARGLCGSGPAHEILRVERHANMYVERYCAVDELIGGSLDWRRYREESVEEFRARVPRSWKGLADAIDECASRGVHFA